MYIYTELLFSKGFPSNISLVSHKRLKAGISDINPIVSRGAASTVTQPQVVEGGPPVQR